MKELSIDEKTIKSAKEEFTKKEVGDGKRGPFYNKNQEWKFDIDNKELFKNAVWQGYLDASRTFTKITDTKCNRTAFNNLAGKIQKYLMGEIEFSHDIWCEDFIEDIENNNVYPSRYGQAQKVINMAFKYLYCCDGAGNYKGKFGACHMPLDQYTLAWLFNEGEPLYQGWSYFNKQEYNKVQGRIKEIIEGKYNGLNVLDVELVIWQAYKVRIINLKDEYDKK